MCQAPGHVWCATCEGAGKSDRVASGAGHCATGPSWTRNVIPGCQDAKPKPKPVGLQTDPQPKAPSQPTPPKLDTPTLLQVLQSLGLGQDLLTKLSSPPREEPGPEKRRTTLMGKITMCQQQMDMLWKQCDNTVKLF